MSEFWKGKRVFLTGHSGFKGSWFSAVLIERGAVLHGYALPAQSSTDLFQTLKLDEKMDSTWADIRELSSLKNALQKFKPDIVIHMAAQALVRESYKTPLETLTVNALGTANLLEACRELPQLKIIINVTTDKVYRNDDARTSFTETSPLGGKDIYSASKACAELITSSYFQSFLHKLPLSVVTARSGNVIGGGDWGPDRLVPDFIRSLQKDQTLVVRNPSSTRPWQHVLDSLRGYMLAAESMYAQGPATLESFNFAPAVDRSVQDVLTTLNSSLTKKVAIQVESAELAEASYLRLDATKAEKELNWKNKWDFETALGRTLNWYQKQFQGEDPWTITLADIREHQKS